MKLTLYQEKNKAALEKRKERFANADPEQKVHLN